MPEKGTVTVDVRFWIVIVVILLVRMDVVEMVETRDDVLEMFRLVVGGPPRTTVLEVVVVSVKVNGGPDTVTFVGNGGAPEDVGRWVDM